MIFFAVVAFILFCLFVLILVLHKRNEKTFASWNKHLSKNAIDEVLLSQISRVNDAEYNYVYYYDNLPLGRITAFLNYFGQDIYNEEPYVFYCKRSSRDNEFREYGCIIARTGIYLSVENRKNKRMKDKDSAVLKAVEKTIKYAGLTNLFCIGPFIISVNFRPGTIFDSYHTYIIRDRLLRDQIRQTCRSVIGNGINFCLQKSMLIYEEGTDNDKEPVLLSSMPVPTESATIENDSIFRNTEKELDEIARKPGIEAAGIQAVRVKTASFFNKEVKNLMNGKQGHGYAAEYANNTFDRALGRSVENAAQQLDHGRQVTHGADRIVNGTEIQTKYCKTAIESVDAAFEHDQAIYLRSDGSGKMMQIEVPRDQYKDALAAMQKRIDDGQVPNVSPGENAENYVRKGLFTYEQSYNIAHAGTIESLAVDAVSGAVCCAAATGITATIMFAFAVWKGNSPKEAAKQCLSSSLAIMGKGTLIYVLTMQLSRKEIAIALAGKAFTADGVSQGYKAVANPIYKVSENLVTKISEANIAKTHLGKKLGLDTMDTRQFIGGTVTVAVVLGPDIVRALQGKISTKQLIKNTTVAAAGMAGAAAAQAAVPIPVVPAIVGGAVAGYTAKKTLDLFIEDDAKEMFRILKEEFIDMTMLVGLSSEEFREVSALTVGSKKISKMLQKMFQSKDYRQYARSEIMQKAILAVMKRRAKISKGEYEKGLIELLAEPT